MADFFVGIDSGGTKTRARLWFPENNVKKDFEVGASNFCSAGFQEGSKNIEILWKMLQKESGKNAKCLGIGVGAAGVSSSDALKMFVDCMERAGIGDIPLKIVSDAQAALYGAVEDDSGVILISGTGSVCFGQNKKGKTHQAGGDGHLIGDEGSGYAIGRDILSAAIKEMDRRGERTVLTEYVLEEKQFQGIQDIIRYVYSGENSKARIAAFAPLLMKACENQDQEARRIAKNASRSLAKQAACVVEQLGEQEGTLAFSGSILKKMPVISDDVRSRLQERFPDLRIIEGKSDALDGALFLIQREAARQVR